MPTDRALKAHWLALIIAIGVWSQNAHAQAIRCTAHRGEDGSYSGPCLRGDTAVAQLKLWRPAATEAQIWRGTRALTDGPTLPFAVDVQVGAGLQFGRDWMAVDVVQNDSVALDFVVSPDRPSPPNEVDAEILRRTLTYLSEPAHWNRADGTDMDAAPTSFDCLPTVARSLLCQLYFASVDVAGHYAHFRPAVNAVRQAINDTSKTRFRHPLVDFNNAASTQLIDVQRVLNAALKRILDQLSNTGTETAAADKSV